MKKTIVFAGLAAAVLAGVCAVRLLNRGEEMAVNARTVVETVKPEIGTIALYTDLIGTVEPEQVARVYAEVSGTVTEVLASAGDTVSAGQLICTVDTKQVESAKNEMDSAQVTYREAQTTLGRITALYQAGSISAQDYEGYVNTARKAEIALQQAQENYERQVSYSSITSPIGGKLEKCDIEALDRVSAGEQLFVVSGEGQRQISFSLTDNLRSHVNLGDSVTAEKNGDLYQGIIVEKSEMADEETGLYKAKIQLESGQELPTGAVVRLSVCSNRAENVMTVPVDAVYYENSLPYVFTFEETEEGGIVHKVFIEAGIYDDSDREVADGLTADTEVITTWSPELYEGAQAVRLADAGETGEAETDE